MARNPRQLDLFAPPAPSPAAELDFADERELAARLPAHVRFGTSSWTFPGWAGIVYPHGTTERDLSARGLALYTRYPLFRTVGIDRSYYAPLDRGTLSRYRAELPPAFPCVMKVWSEIVSAVHPRTREKNPRFLDVATTLEHVIDPVLDTFAEHAGPLVFELPPLRRGELPHPSELAERLGRFFGALPKQLSYAVELRNRELMTRDYFDVLKSSGVGHVLSFWERMPDIGEQLAQPDVLTAPVVVTRLLIPPGRSYEARKRELHPFDRIVDPQEKMRADVERLSRACEALGKVLLVIVNNKAEGSSPLTVRALAERLARPRGAVP